MNMFVPWVSLFVFILSLTITRILIKYLSRKGQVDIPNQRSSHTVATPRGGGLAIFIAFLTGAGLLFALNPLESLPGIWFWIALWLIGMTSYLDDRVDLPAGMRFGLHAVAALLVSLETGGLQAFPLPEPYSFSLGIFNYPLTFLWILGVLNIYNFLDGIDGFAAVQGMVACTGLALLNPFGVSFSISVLLFAAIAGFLVYNWPPARIFMGDIGSTVMGFIFAVVPLYFEQIPVADGIFSMGIFLWFFLADGAFTIVRRLVAGEKIWEAHRSHLYQRLVIKGMSHARVTSRVMTAAALLMLIYVGFYHYYREGLMLVFLLALILFGVYVWMERKG